MTRAASAWDSHLVTSLLACLLLAAPGCGDTGNDGSTAPADRDASANADSSLDGPAPDADASPPADSAVDAGEVSDAEAGVVDSTLALYDGLPGDLYRSDKYAVSVGIEGQPESASYVYKTDNDNNPGEWGLMQWANHWTSFSFSGTVTVKVTVPGKGNISSAFLRPGNRQLTGLSGNTVTFTIDTPGNYYVEVDDDLSLDPLFVFANPPETDVPSTAESNVIVLQSGTHDPGAIWEGGGKSTVYFGPGLHDLGTSAALVIPPGNQVYLAGGAFVRGIFYLEEGEGTTVNGRGILSGIDYPATSWGHTPMIDGLRWGAPMGVRLEGITLVDSPGINAFVEGNDQSEVVIDNLKLMAWHDQTDGLGGAPNTIIRNCFLKVYDDQLHLTRQNVRLYDNAVWLQGQGSAIQMGWNAADSTTSNHVDGLYVIHDNMHSSGFDDDHRNSNIVSMRELRGGAARSNIVFENIVQEGGNLYQAFGIRLNEPWFGGDYGQGNGSLSEIIFRNCTIGGMPRYRSVFNGEGSVPGTQISGLRFENVRMGGVLLDSSSAGAYLDIQNQCYDVTYSP